MTVSLATVPYSAAQAGLWGGIGGSFAGLLAGRRREVYNLDHSRLEFRSLSAYERVKKVVVGGVIGMTAGFAAGALLDLALQVTIVGILALANLTARLWSAAAYQMPQVTAFMSSVAGEVATVALANPITFSMVISTIAMLALISCANSREKNLFEV